eukprot:6214510-Pleurochrysis_carterae.AAC.2
MAARRHAQHVLASLQVLVANSACRRGKLIVANREMQPGNFLRTHCSNLCSRAGRFLVQAG